MRALSVALLAMIVAVAAANLISATDILLSEDKNTTTHVAPTTAPATEAPGNNDNNPSSAPWNATSTATAAPAAVFFTIGGLVIIAQVVYCIWYNKNKQLYPDASLLMGNNNDQPDTGRSGGSQIDMESNKPAHSA